MKSRSLTCFLAVTLAGSVPAQTIPEGYVANVTVLPAGAGNVLTIPSGTIYFDGKLLTLDDGKKRRTLLSFQSAVFGSFTRDVGSGRVLFGESSSGDVWLVHVVAKIAPKKLATLKFNYDAVPYSKDWAIVSAKTGGFTAKNNDVIAVNLNTGKTDNIASLPGASGPITVDAAGNLYYATASATFPPKKGSVDVLRFDWRTVRSAFGATNLTATSATKVFGGLDAAGAIELDDDGDLFFTDWVNKRIGEIHDIDRKNPTQTVFMSYSGAKVSAGSLQFVAMSGSGYAEFEPFQPAGAGRLHVHESAFGSTSQIRALATRRATTTLSISKPKKGKAFYVQVRNGPASGAGFVALGFGFGAVIRERALIVPGFEATVPWQVDLLSPAILVPVAFDGNGAANLGLIHPGVIVPLKINVQAGFADQAGRIAGSSAPLRFVLD